MGALIMDIDFLAPPSAHHEPNTNSSCQQNGLKYHSPHKHSVARSVRRRIHHTTTGKSPINLMKPATPPSLPGLNSSTTPCRSVSIGLSTRPATLNSLMI